MPERIAISRHASIFDFMPPTAIALVVPPRQCLSMWKSICSMTEIIFASALPKFSMTPSTVVKITNKSAGKA